MPWHIKKISIFRPSDPIEYYVGNNRWTNEYDKRKVYSNEEDAIALKNTTVTVVTDDKSITYQPQSWKGAIVVSE